LILKVTFESVNHATVKSGEMMGDKVKNIILSADVKLMMLGKL